MSQKYLCFSLNCGYMYVDGCVLEIFDQMHLSSFSKAVSVVCEVIGAICVVENIIDLKLFKKISET